MFHYLSRRQMLLASLTLSLSSLGCASSGGGSEGSAASADCTLSAADSVFLASGPVYRDCEVDRRARLIPSSVVLDYRPLSRPPTGSRCHVVVVDLVVNERGLPEATTAQLVRSTDPQFAKAVMESVPQWRYEPAQKAGANVRQIVRERREYGIVVTVVAVGRGSSPPPPPNTRPPC